MTGNETRRAFLDYFKTNGHRVVKSASLVPADDPTLLFTNAGMVQFKRTFLGEEARDYSRAATSQKCVRAGGKHNDLENVGYTARHHTFFEMLGNFSFGDYFKEAAIELAWKFLTVDLGLPVEKLRVSVFRDDDEAAGIWRDKIGVRPERILRLGEKDNFWAMGDTGPCGPCSEIHIDRGAGLGCGSPDCGVECGCDRFLEIWNLVFMQYNRDADGTMAPLPRPSIDTGMGLERIVSVLQNAPANYGTDLFAPILARVQELSGKSLGASRDDDVCMKVIADHSRAAAFLVGDGVLPSNEGRGYVLRRIMRRAIRYGRQLGLAEPFLHETAAAVALAMEEPYPELAEARAFIGNVILNEENRFRETLDNGLKVLTDGLSELEAKGETTIPGDFIFKLYDTYGFPVDIVEDVVRDKGLHLDKDGFAKAMDRQRAQSRTVTAFTGASEAFRALTSQGFASKFVGYAGTRAESRVVLVSVDGKEADEAGPGTEVQVVTEETPFYGESGGQTGDVGVMRGDGLEVEIVHTRKDPTGLVVHTGRVTKGAPQKGMAVTLEVDTETRGATMRNHSATHLLHAALRQVLGDHAKQSGSYVGPDRLRFDFTHFSALSQEEKEQIEDIVNAGIRANLAVSVEEMDADTARKSGAVALFDEKYGDTVRVVSMEDASRELCGGTHVSRTGDIGLFLIVAESSVAAGVRRIEALTGAGALLHVRGLSRSMDGLARLLRDKAEAVPERVEKLAETVKAQEREIAKLKTAIATGGASQGAEETVEVKGVKVFTREVPADNPGAMREAGDRFRDKLASGVVVIGAKAGDKAMLLAMVTKDLTGKIKAGDIIKRAAGIVGGSGGGRPDMAQAGGSRPEKVGEALAAIPKIVEELLG
jgi:alanyl-tRNA synthetase